VHDADRYPLLWPSEPLRWLAGRDCFAAWVEEADGQLLGHLSLHRADATRARNQWREAVAAPANRLAVVSRFFVAPHARGRGVGGRLLAHAEEHAAAHDLHLVLDVAEHNCDAIGFYARRGWQQVGRAELALDAEPWRLELLLFVRG
jgi:GNAT superfamily N-acetyltransferase